MNSGDSKELTGVKGWGLFSDLGREGYFRELRGLCMGRVKGL